MTSPRSTSSETRSTASRDPYRLVSWSATMTGGMRGLGSGCRWGAVFGPQRQRATSNVQQPRLLEDLRRVRVPRLAGGAVEVVRGHEARAFAGLQRADVLVRVQDARRVVGERHVREQV